MSRYCNVCGQLLRGSHYVYERGDVATSKGLLVCSRCERTASRCTVCRVPINPNISLAGLCTVCQSKLPRCTSCGKQVRGQYYRNNASEAIYCDACFRFQPRCSICGTIVSPAGMRLHDGRHICKDCHTTAVYDVSKAAECYSRVTGLLASELGLRLSIVPVLSLVDREQMLSVLRQTRTTDGDQPDLVFGLFVRRGRKRVIYVEYGLPQILMMQVMAHELAHAWQGENGPLLRDPLWREGFAEWVAYRVLTALGAVKKAALMRQRTDIYGQGLEAVLRVERQGGASAVLGRVMGSAVQVEMI